MFAEDTLPQCVSFMIQRGCNEIKTSGPSIVSATLPLKAVNCNILGTTNHLNLGKRVACTY